MRTLWENASINFLLSKVGNQEFIHVFITADAYKNLDSIFNSVELQIVAELGYKIIWHFIKWGEKEMREVLNFYTIYEFEDEENFYKRNGFKPYTSKTGEMDDEPFLCVTQYIKNGVVYDVLESTQCYSGAMVTLARVPPLGYDDLLDIALKTRNSGERRGAIGMILKNHPQKLESFLENVQQESLPTAYTRKEVCRLIRFINNDIYPCCLSVREIEKVFAISKQLENNI